MKPLLTGLAAIACMACTSTSATDSEMDKFRRAEEESARRYQQALEESRLSKCREDAKEACHSVFMVVTEGCVNILSLRYKETTESALQDATSCLNARLDSLKERRYRPKGHPDCNEPMKTNLVNFSWMYTQSSVCLAVAPGSYQACLKGAEEIFPDPYQDTAGERR